MKTNYVKGDVIHFELDNNPAHKGVGTFVEYNKCVESITVSLLGNCNELKMGTDCFIFSEEII